MNLSSTLYRLQLVDTQIDQANSRLAQIETALNDKTELLLAEDVLKAALSHLHAEQKKLREIEYQVQEQRIKVQLNETNLYSGKVRNPKELQDIQNEIVSLKKYIATLEERQFESMVDLDNAEKVHQQADNEHAAAQGKYSQNQATLKGERTALQEKLERFHLERQAASQSVPPQDLEMYEQLRKSKSGIAVTRVVDRSCSSCGAQLTPAIIQAASSPAQLVRCTSCGRIVFPG